MRLRNVAVAVAISLPVGLGGSALADGDGPFKKIPISFTAGPPLPGGTPGGELTTDCTTGDACVAGLTSAPEARSLATSRATTSRCSPSARRQAAARRSSPGRAASPEP